MEETGLPLIIAAVECSHDPENGRLQEYAPFSFYDPAYGGIVAKGPKTMEWMVNEFKPYVDANYPTLPEREHTFIAGSSMGGLMSLYAVLSYNEIFSGAAALSPSIWTAPDQIEKMIKKAKVQEETTLYLDYGSEELKVRENFRMAEHFGYFTSLLIEKGIFVTSRIVPHGVHTESNWEKQIPYFMEALLYPFLTGEEED